MRERLSLDVTPGPGAPPGGVQSRHNSGDSWGSAGELLVLFSDAVPGVLGIWGAEASPGRWPLGVCRSGRWADHGKMPRPELWKLSRPWATSTAAPIQVQPPVLIFKPRQQHA